MSTHESRSGGPVMRSARQSTRRIRRLGWLAVLSVAAIFMPIAHAGQLSVTLLDGATAKPLSGQTLQVFQRAADGTRKWVARLPTDSSGRAVFDLGGLGTGRKFQILAKPYGRNIWSALISKAGSHRFEVGKLRVRVLSGVDRKPLANTKVTLHKRQSDGKFTHVSQFTTGADGLLRIDPPAFGNGGRFVLRARSTVDASTKSSEAFTKPGIYEFVVGTKGLTVTLANSINGKPLSGQELDVFKRLSDGSRKWVAKRQTDKSGRAIFDLSGLGAGTAFQIRVSPYHGSVWSAPITQTGNFRFDVGRLQVRVLNGTDRKPLARTEVTLHRMLANGEFASWKTVTTDAGGVLRLDPPGFGSGYEYVLRARSGVDNSTKRSEIFSKPGGYEFVVGSSGLTVTLTNGVSGKSIAGQTMNVFKRLADGTSRQLTERETNADGQAQFDLEELKEGQSYELLAAPFGRKVWATDVPQTGGFKFLVGTTQVRLVDARTGGSLPGRTIRVFHKAFTGKLAYVSTAKTDTRGIAHFDLPGLDSRRPHVFFAENVFDDDRKYVSQVAVREGAIDFVIDPDVHDRLDKHPPELTVRSPTNGDKVADGGFSVTGAASDNVGVTRISVTVVDPVGGTVSATAKYDPYSERWNAHIPGGALTAGRKASLTVKAEDEDRNATTVERQVQVVKDDTGPAIWLTSHDVDDAIPETGTLVHGLARDEVGSVKLSVSVRNSKLGITQPERALDVAESGRWTLALRGKHQVAGTKTTVLLSAVDDAGNITRKEQTFGVEVRGYRLRQLVNRTSFGASPELLSMVSDEGFDAYLDAQLSPDSIDDSDLALRLDSLDPTSSKHFQAEQILRAVFGRRQLQEVMTVFWDNHFSTNLGKHGKTQFERRENEQFRANALGNFRDLLGISATSPAMLIYLDNVRSTHKGPNENYARELLELHTLGLAGGEPMSAAEPLSGAFAQDDIIDVARVFTGWRVHNGAFKFYPFYHDGDVKEILGQVIVPSDQTREGEQVLDMLAASPYTADRVCDKLAMLLVSDTPSDKLIATCVGTFLDHGAESDQIARVVSELLRSDEFSQASSYRAKVKTPLEFLAGTVRAFGVEPDALALRQVSSRMGMNLFKNIEPNGFAEYGSSWLGSGQLLERLLFVRSTVFDGVGKAKALDAKAFVLDNDVETAEGVVGFLFQLAFDDPVRDADWNIAMDILTRDGTSEFVIDGKDSQHRLQEVVSMVFSYPGFNYQ